MKSRKTKALLLGLYNLIAVAILFIAISDMSSKAQEVKRLKSLNLRQINSEIKIIESNIKNYEKQNAYLKKLFPDDTGFIQFIKEIDSLKKEGSVAQFSFASNDIVIDQTKNIGLPINIEFQGSKEKVNQALQKVLTLPYLFRPITTEIRITTETKEEDKQSEVVVIKLGGFLYVAETINQN